jgi:hypothetical protein
MGQTAVIPGQIVGVAARSLLGNNTNAEAACQTISFAAASAGHVLTVQGDGTVAFAAVSAGIGGSTGSTDNLVLRADGTGGATLQSSGWLIPDIYTSSPNATVNHLSLQATGSSTNVSVSIVPKGSGAFSLQVPDGTATGGNARGAGAVDLQLSRTAATQVAAGPNSFAAGLNNTTGGSGSIALGSGSSASNAGYVIGSSCTNSGYSSLVGGVFSSGTANEGAFGFGRQIESNATYGAVFNLQSNVTGVAAFVTGARARGRLSGERAHASGSFGNAVGDGDCQHVENILRGKTTTNSAVELFLGISANERFIIPAGYIWHGLAIVTGTKSDGSAVAIYMRQVAIKRVTNTTSLVGAVATIGTDQAAGTSLSITADDTNESLKVEPTGVLNETWRWECILDGGLIAYGT